MFTPNFDFADIKFNNSSFFLFTSNTDYNMKKHLETMNQYPLNESIIEDNLDIENDIFNRHLLFKDDYSSTFISSSIFEDQSNSIISVENKESNAELKNKAQNCEKFTEFSSINESSKDKKKPIFDVVYDKEFFLFTKNSKINLNNDDDDKFNFLKTENEKILNKKRKKRRRRRENRDNIRKKIKCGFLNGNVIKNLNKKLRSIGSRLFFDKFPQIFIGDVGKESNKKLLNLSLNELFEKKELYKEKEYSYYNHNLKVARNEDVQNNYSMRQIMNMKYSQLYEYYINSEEFVDEINRLKKKGMNDDYVKNYIYLAKHFLEFFQN